MGARHLRKVSTRFAGVNCIVNLYSPNATLLCLFRHPRINRIYHAPEVRYEHQYSPVSKAQMLYREPENPRTPEKTSAGNADERVGPIGMGHRNNQNRADTRGTQPILEDMSLSPGEGSCGNYSRQNGLCASSFISYALVNLFTELISSPFQINSKCAVWITLRTCLGVNSPQQMSPGFRTEWY
jgi:hypothetical protein